MMDAAPQRDDAGAGGRRAGRRAAGLYAVFFVSGFCGLIYESIWSHYLKLLLGHAAYAQAVVLVVFVGGLALGAWLTGRWSERIRNPIAVYAAVEAVVGLIAFAFHAGFVAVSDWASTSLLPAVCAETGPCSASWLLAAAIILLPSVLLGTTFPLMSAGVIRLGVRPGRGLSLLYFLNSAGAALGVLASGFLLIPLLGLPGTLLLAGSFNVLVALASWLLGLQTTGQDSRPVVPAPAPAGSALGTGRLRLLLAVAALTGLSSFIYEVVWIRMLTLVLGAATHSFELMLATFIAGLAGGAWWIRNRIDGRHDLVLLLARVQVLMGLAAVATLPLYVLCFDAMAFVLRALTSSHEGYLMFNSASLLLAAAVMLPASFCAGMTLPLVTALLLRAGFGERQIGQVYGVNTAGAIAGVLLAVHVAIPLLGLPWSLSAAALVDIALGAWLWLHRDAAPIRHGWRWAAVGLATAAGAAVALPWATDIGPLRLASGVYRHGGADMPADRTVLFHEDGKTGTITVLEGRNGVRSLRLNGKSDGATHPGTRLVTQDDHTVVLLGALGPAHHPQARRAAVIGMGTGVSSAVLLESPALEVLDTIEIEPQVVRAAQWFRPRNAKALDDARGRLVIDDARAHFARTPARYDLVVSEPSNPWVSGVSGLFTEEFYLSVHRQLADDGHFVQWLHLYEASPEMIGSILRALEAVFPAFKAYFTNSLDVVLVARKDGVAPRLDRAGLERMPGLRARLREIGIDSFEMLAAHEAARAGALMVLFNSYGAPPNSDFYPYVDAVAARDRVMRRSAQSAFEITLGPVPLLEFAGGAPDYLEAVAGQAPLPTAPPRIHRILAAAQGERYLRGDGGAAPADDGLARSYALARSWMAACRLPSPQDRSWEALVEVAGHMNPGISPARARAFWDGLRTGRCARATGPVQAAWLELFGAVGARDAAATRAASDRLLAGGGDAGPQARLYLLQAAVASRLAQGQYPQARELFEAQLKSFGPAEQAWMETPWMRYLSFLMTLSLQSGGAAAARPPAS